MSPFPLVSSGPSGPLIIPSCWARSNRSKDLAERRSQSDRSGSWSLRRWGRACIRRICPTLYFRSQKSVFADVDNCLAHFAEFRCPLCRKKFGKMGKVGTLCRIRQNGFRQTVPYSFGQQYRVGHMDDKSVDPLVDQIDQLTDIFEEISIFVVWLGRFAPFAKSKHWGMAIWHVAPLRFAPAFRALGVCEHIWSYSLRGHLGNIIVAEMDWNFVAQMPGDETSLPSHRRYYHDSMGNR